MRNKEQKRIYMIEYGHKNKTLLSKKHREYYLKNKEKIKTSVKNNYYKNIDERRRHNRKYSAERTKKLRMKAILSIGELRCAACGFCSNVRALVIDHINGGGGKERRLFPAHGLYTKIIKDKNRKKKYQILCCNCNIIKQYEKEETAKKYVS